MSLDWSKDPLHELQQTLRLAQHVWDRQAFIGHTADREKEIIVLLHKLERQSKDLRTEIMCNHNSQLNKQ